MSASIQGSPALADSFENATAPMAAKVTWHSETYPDVRASSPSDSSRMT